MTNSRFDVVVIGAGWAGLSAASALDQQGLRVCVVEKSRGPGGRSATRRQGTWLFDHGAQYFTAKTKSFQQALDAWAEQGLVGPWEASIEVFGPRPSLLEKSVENGPITRWVGVPGNNAVLKSMACSLLVHYGHRVTDLRRQKDHWVIELVSDNGPQQLMASKLVITAPPAQAADLLGPDHRLWNVLHRHPMNPTWALMVGFDDSAPIDPMAGFVNTGPVGWFCSQGSKPQRPADAWVIHATPQWSSDFLEKDADWVAAKLLQAWQECVGPIVQKPSLVAAHRWRFAQSPKPLDSGCLQDADDQVWVAGDWCCGNRVEGAWLSGQAVAQSVTS